MSELTGRQRRYLRVLGQQLDATLHVGRDGVTDAVVRQTEVQLDAHELIKVRLSEQVPEGRHDAAGLLAARTRSHLAQVLGRTALLYRARKDEPSIRLPD